MSDEREVDRAAVEQNLEATVPQAGGPPIDWDATGAGGAVGTTTTLYSVGEIAKACHEAVRGYNLGIGDPPLEEWDACGSSMQGSACDGVVALLLHPEWGPERNHQSWVEWKTARGWVYGPEKDVEAKTHPDLVEWGALPASQRAKNAIFVGIVRALAGQVKSTIKEAVPPEAAI